jgi:hypothetical protein
MLIAKDRRAGAGERRPAEQHPPGGEYLKPPVLKEA